MIDVYRWSDAGVAQVSSDLAIAAADLPGTWVWVDVVDEDDNTIRAVGEAFRIDPAIIEESLVTTHLPQVEEHLRVIYVVLHGLTTGEGQRLATPETDVFIGERFLVTIRDGRRASIETLKERLASEGNIPVTSPAGLLGFLAHHAGRHYVPLITELEQQVDGLEELAIQGDPQTAVEVHALRRDVIYLRRALAPQFDVYEDLSESTHPAIDAEARLLFLRVATQHRRALDAVETGRALLGSVLETYRGALADQTNEIMRVLTVFSAILLPLSLIAGMWGMNFIRIPGAEDRYGFWILVGIMLVLAAGVWLYFVRRGFVGAPRVRDLPKAVGLGIYNIGSAPIRMVAGGIRGLSGSDDEEA